MEQEIGGGKRSHVHGQKIGEYCRICRHGAQGSRPHGGKTVERQHQAGHQNWTALQTAVLGLIGAQVA